MKWGKPCEQEDRRIVALCGARGERQGMLRGTKCKSPGSGRGASPKAGID